MRQLALELASSPAPTLDNFVTGANAEVVTALQALVHGAGADRFIYLWGGTGSGCTHLLRAVARDLCAAGRNVRWYAADTVISAEAVAGEDVVVVDDVQCLSESAQIKLFNIFNKLRDFGGILLAAGDVPPARLPLRGDLLTRLAWGLVYEVHALSEDDRRAAVQAYAAARGFVLPREVTDFLLVRLPRDLHSLRAMVDMLDRHSLEQKRAVTVPLARELLLAAQKTNDLETGKGGSQE